MRNRIHRMCRGHFTGKETKDQGFQVFVRSPRSMSTHSKCRWCFLWQRRACLARHRFPLQSVAERGLPSQTQSASSRVKPAPCPPLPPFTSCTSALPSALRVTSCLRKRRLGFLPARILGSDTVLALTDIVLALTWQGSCLVPVSHFLLLSLSSSKRLLCWFLFC